MIKRRRLPEHLFLLTTGILVLSILLYSCRGGESTEVTESAPAPPLTSSATSKITTSTTTPKMITSTTTETTISTTTETTVTTAEETTLTEIYKSGLLTEDETWSGIVHITGDVTLKAELTLTILPGTKVLFAAHQDDQHSEGAVPLDDWIAQHNDPTWTEEYAQSHSSMAIYGTLIARGTPENRITFTSDSPTPDAGDWIQVHFGHNSIIQYCIIEYARGGLDTMVNTGESITIDHNIIRNTLWSGISIHSSSPTVTNNEIIHAGGHQGIDVIGEGSAPLITHNIIKECMGGINILDGNSPIIEYNTLINNEHPIGVSGQRTNAIIRHNSISCPDGPSSHFTYKGEVIYPSMSLLNEQFFISGIVINNASPIISNNEISNCNCAGIDIMGVSSPIITGNTIHQNVEGILFQESFTGTPVIERNNIFDNRKSNIKLWPGMLLTAVNNWWGTTDIEEIKAKFLNIYDEPGWELVIFEPFLLEPVKTE